MPRSSAPSADAAAAMMSTGKLSICAYIMCPGRASRPKSSCFVCVSGIHESCFPEICLGQNYTPGNMYCSVQCIRYDNDDSIDNGAVKAKREFLLGQNKNQLRTFAQSLGAKISYRPPGQGSKTCRRRVL